MINEACAKQTDTFSTGPSNGLGASIVLHAGICHLSSSVTLTAGRVGSRQPPGQAHVRPTLHGGPVWLRPVRATLLFAFCWANCQYKWLYPTTALLCISVSDFNSVGSWSCWQLLQLRRFVRYCSAVIILMLIVGHQ